MVIMIARSAIIKGKKYSGLILVCLAVVVYIIYWSLISLYRLYTFQSGVFDLGMMAQEFWLVYHQPFFTISTLSGFLNRDVMYIFSPLTFFDSYPPILITQTIFLGVPAIFIYLIANTVLKNKVTAFVLAFSYLMYPLLAGINWFDVHNQAFFIFFFLLAFYLFLKNRYFLSTTFFIISGMTHYLYLILVLLFALPFVLEAISHHIKRHSTSREILWGSIIFFLAFIILLSSFYLNTIQNVSVSAVIHTGSLSLTYELRRKFLVFLIAFAPLALIPLFPNRYMLLLIPFFLLVFLSQNYGYFFPTVTQDQYASMLDPGIYISSIFGIKNIIIIHEKRKKKKIKIRKSVLLKVITLSIVVLTLCSAIVLEPYGPLNHDSSNAFDTTKPNSFYLPLFNEFNKVVSLIPKNATSVVIGDGEPTAIPRGQIPNAPLLITPYNLAGNLSYLSNSGKWIKASPQYVLGNPYSVMFTLSADSEYNLSMFSLLQKLYNSGEYGILAEASGIVLLEKNYSGPMRYFVPINYTMFGTYLTAPGLSLLGDGPIYSKSDSSLKITSSDYLNGPTFLPPGFYNISLYLNNLNVSGNDSIKLYLENNGGSTIAEATINQSYADLSVSLHTYLYSMNEYVRFFVFLGKDESLSISKICVVQRPFTFNDLVMQPLFNVSVKKGTLTVTSLNISHYLPYVNDNFSNVMISLNNLKLIDAYAATYNKATGDLELFMDHIGLNGNVSLKFLIFTKDANLLSDYGPMSVTPFISHSYGSDNANTIFEFYQNFYSGTLGSNWTVKTNGAKYPGSVEINHGLYETTNSTEGLNIFSRFGFKLPVEFTYIINFTSKVSYAPYLIETYDFDVSVLSGNSSYLYVQWTSISGLEELQRIQRPQGISVLSIKMENSSLSIEINGQSVITGSNLYGSGYCPIDLFDMNSGVTSPLMESAFVSLPYYVQYAEVK